MLKIVFTTMSLAAVMAMVSLFPEKEANADLDCAVSHPDTGPWDTNDTFSFEYEDVTVKGYLDYSGSEATAVCIDEENDWDTWIGTETGCYLWGIWLTAGYTWGPTYGDYNICLVAPACRNSFTNEAGRIGICVEDE